MTQLRPFQSELVQKVFDAWRAGHINVMIKSATGTGKTVILAYIVKAMDCASVVIAHRGELVSQISLALAREGVRHRIIGSDQLRKTITTLHMQRFKRSFIEPTSRVGVASVDTLVNMDPEKDPWFAQVGLWVQDEGHHVQAANKWGRAAQMFRNARGLAPTATPRRADGRGLGRACGDGLMDALIEGPPMSWAIQNGYLTRYDVFGVASDVDYGQVNVTATGDLNQTRLRQAVHASTTIVGDVVKSYLKFSMQVFGRLALGVTFAVDVEAAQELAQAYRDAGVPAEVVSAKTPDTLRVQILDRFARKQVLQLVNVDLFGEGFDLPAIEAVSMVRKTESWPLYVQQFGRALRLMITDEQAAVWGDLTSEQRLGIIAGSSKPCALIIDHVGNVTRHGRPDRPITDTLAAREKRSSEPGDEVPMRICANDKVDGIEGKVCAERYERYRPACPKCQHEPEPAERRKPSQVDGDLYKLDLDELDRMRGDVVDVNAPIYPPKALNAIAVAALVKSVKERADAQVHLRDAMQLWAGWQQHQGLDNRTTIRKFYAHFGVDSLSALALGAPDARELTERINSNLNRNGVVRA